MSSTKFTLENCTIESHTLQSCILVGAAFMVVLGCKWPVGPRFTVSGRTKVISSRLSVFILSITVFIGSLLCD